MPALPEVHVCYADGTFRLPPGYTDHPPDRFASTAGDNLVEWAGRTCYDSALKTRGRSSADYHAHIHETGHASVWAHLVDTFEAQHPNPLFLYEVLGSLQNRPGVWVTEIGPAHVRFAASLRAVVEWPKHGVGSPDHLTGVLLRDRSARIRRQIVRHLAPKYPLVLGAVAAADAADRALKKDDALIQKFVVKAVAPRLDAERWVSLYLTGVSRRFLQDWVRHHYQANPSVRSTRYCDEGDSTQIVHPATAEAGLADYVTGVWEYAKAAYREVYRQLSDRGVDHKSARGAAGGVLPEATETRLVFSLSLFQARHILNLRLKQTSGPADPEVSRAASLVAEALRAPPVAWDV